MKTPRRAAPERVALALTLALLSPLMVGAEDSQGLAGTWSWIWKDGEGVTHRHVLEVEGMGANLSARERFDDQSAVKISDLKVVGKRVNFSVLRGDRRAAYSGTMDSTETINGLVVISGEGGQPSEFGWTAKRESEKQK